MSAWIVSKEHIDLLIQAGIRFAGHGDLRWCIKDTNPIRYGELNRSNADVIGGKLWAENLASVTGRYPHDASGERPGPVDFEDTDTLTYTFDEVPGELDPVVVLKALSCFEYQSCEHDGWESSEARLICEAVRSACINALPGYDAAPWGFDERRFFLV